MKIFLIDCNKIRLPHYILKDLINDLRYIKEVIQNMKEYLEVNDNLILFKLNDKYDYASSVGWSYWKESLNYYKLYKYQRFKELK